MNTGIRILAGIAAALVLFAAAVHHPSMPTGRTGETPLKEGPEVENGFFLDWHHPEPLLLDPAELSKIWDTIEQQQQISVQKPSSESRWTCIGPYGMNVITAPGTRYSGRVRDLEVNAGVGLRVAAATGGLFEFDWGIPKPLSDDLTSLASGSFATKPGDTDLIILGTGEPSCHAGQGVFRTTDGGDSWSKSILTGGVIPDGCYKIRFQPQYPDRIHLACTSGYYISEDDGLNFRQTLSGNLTDFDFAGYDGDIWAAIRGRGFFHSHDGGETWEQVTIPDIDNGHVGRTAVSAYDRDTICYSVTDNSNHNTLSVVKSTDGGLTWQDISPGGDVHWGQGWYANTIGVSPVDPDRILLGGGHLHRSLDGGTTWTELTMGDYPDLHADINRIIWSLDGSTVYICGDGGFTVSYDMGMTWDTWGNILPITQYVGIDAHATGVIWGGSQDNGISGTSDGAVTWVHSVSGDGGRAAIDPMHANIILVTNGVYHGNWDFERLRSDDYGMTWTHHNSGIYPSGQWNNALRFDPKDAGTLYHHAGSWVYKSGDRGTTWERMNTSELPAPYTLDLSVSNGIVWVPLDHRALDDHTGTMLRVYAHGIWYERSYGLPSHLHVHTVIPHPSDDLQAYALMTGLTPGAKVYRTADQGQNWINITGDLPNVIAGDLVVHPSNDQILYLGTYMGCYRSRDAGTTWHRWNEGMPNAVMISDMTAVDSISANGTYYILAATWGRSIWQREISNEDPVTGVVDGSGQPDGFKLYPAYPNPCNSQTVISYTLPEQGRVTLTLCSVLGREEVIFSREEQTAGSHIYILSAEFLPSGIYLVSLRYEKHRQVQKLVINR